MDGLSLTEVELLLKVISSLVVAGVIARRIL